jgi:hypothetical protein
VKVLLGNGIFTLLNRFGKLMEAGTVGHGKTNGEVKEKKIE